MVLNVATVAKIMLGLLVYQLPGCDSMQRMMVIVVQLAQEESAHLHQAKPGRRCDEQRVWV